MQERLERRAQSWRLMESAARNEDERMSRVSSVDRPVRTFGG